MNMDKAKKILTHILIAFALISIGFALGKNSIPNRDESDAIPESNSQDYVAVYYMHSTFRCVTCNTIEAMTKDLLDRKYAEPMADGSIQWQDVDFQENDSLARQFEVIASCVVVAKISKSKIIDFKRLDDVWTLMKNPVKFDKYISKTIDSYLTKIRGGV